MVFLRAAFLELLVCVHFIGAAMLFRRWFPRESPWLCFLLPVLVVLSALNFIEHYIALSDIGWLLPLTLGGSIWILLKPDNPWEGLRFPALLFLGLFTFMFALRCIAPEITNTNEGVSNLTRILNYSLGGTLPQIDCFLPPYDYGIYYSFQHYGAAILERLFYADLGSAYNVGYAFLLAWLCLTAAGVAHSISGKIWFALASMLVLMSSWTGSCPYLVYLHPMYGGDYDLSTNLNRDWGNPDGGPFSRFYVHGAIPPPALLLQPPLINLYWGEFHSTLGGNFVTVAAMLAVCEIFKPQRTNWSWIALFALPLVSIVTSSWFFFTIAFVCAGSFVVALIAGRRPESWKFTCFGCMLAAVFLWPFIYSITGIGTPVQFSWTQPQDHTPLWMFLIQWWPVFIPWLLLCFVWLRLNVMSRWMLLALPILFLVVEFVTIGDRKLTTEKLWASIYTFGIVTLVPMVVMRRGLLFRAMALILVLLSPICMGETIYAYYPNPLTAGNVAHLTGNQWILEDAQKKRLLQVLSQFHGQTILPGRSYWDFSQSPGVVDFSENRCWVAYTFHEYHCGRGAEADYRSKLDNNFYDGKIADPLSFLKGNNIAAVLIWPEDAIPDQRLKQFQDQLGPEFFYIDCKMDGANNAGLFVRQADLEPMPGMVGYSTQN